MKTTHAKTEGHVSTFLNKTVKPINADAQNRFMERIVNKNLKVSLKSSLHRLDIVRKRSRWALKRYIACQLGIFLLS